MIRSTSTSATHCAHAAAEQWPHTLVVPLQRPSICSVQACSASPPPVFSSAHSHAQCGAPPPTPRPPNQWCPAPCACPPAASATRDRTKNSSPICTGGLPSSTRPQWMMESSSTSVAPTMRLASVLVTCTGLALVPSGAASHFRSCSKSGSCLAAASSSCGEGEVLLAVWGRAQAHAPSAPDPSRAPSRAARAATQHARVRRR